GLKNVRRVQTLCRPLVWQRLNQVSVRRDAVRPPDPARCRRGVIEMASGGARNRSGPPLDPNSGRSERRGVKLTALPNEGYRGEVPEFPIPGASDRVLEIWASLWERPQAAAWALQPWRWDAVGE